MKAVLVQLPSGVNIQLDKDKTVIGRNPDNDVVATEAFVSRRHCAVVRKGAGFFLEDLESSNGTFVNGERIEESQRLRHNDTIALGRQSRAYQFRNTFPFLRGALDFLRRPRNVVLIGVGVALLFGFGLYFFMFRNIGRIDAAAGLRHLETAHGMGALPREPAFVQAVEARVEAVQREANFAETAERRLQYRGMIEDVLRRNNLPVDYSLVPWVESSYRPQARNYRSGAAGMWQLLPATARAYGLAVNRKTDERLDPEKSTRAAALYLKDLVSMLGKDSFLLVLAAYNAGDSAVLYNLKQIQDPVHDRNFWYLYRNNLLPPETKEYVLRIVALIIVAEKL